MRTVAIVDVAPGGAVVAISGVPKDGPSTIFSTASSSLSLERRTKVQSKSRIAEQIKEASDQALKLAAAAGHAAPVSDVYVVVHAPWSETTLSSTHESYETETRIHASRIEALAQESLALSKDIDKGKLIESSVIKVELNGYPTPSPEGKYAHDLRVTSIMSVCEAGVRAAVESAVHASFPVARVSWRSALRGLMTVAREAHFDRSFLLIDMGVEETHIASYVDGTLKQLIIREGTGTIVSRISAGRPAEETVGFMRMLSRDACSTDACDALKQSIASIEPELVRVFGDAIGKVGAGSRVPNDVVLLAHQDIENWLAGFLTRIDFAQFTITTLPLSVHTVRSLELSAWVAGVQTSDAIAVDATLVNIESRA